MLQFFSVNPKKIYSLAKTHYNLPNAIIRDETRKRINNAINSGELNITFHSEGNARSMADNGVNWKMYCKDQDGNVFQHVSKQEIDNEIEKKVIEIIAEFI